MSTCVQPMPCQEYLSIFFWKVPWFIFYYEKPIFKTNQNNLVIFTTKKKFYIKNEVNVSQMSYKIIK